MVCDKCHEVTDVTYRVAYDSYCEECVECFKRSVWEEDMVECECCGQMSDWYYDIEGHYICDECIDEFREEEWE